MKKAVFLIILLLSTLSITGCSVKKMNELTDAEKFAKEFGISQENPFVYTDIDTILKILENGTGIIFFANSDYEGSIKAAEYVTEIAKQEEVKNIYYYNPKKLEEKKPKKYKKLMQYLKEYATDDFLLPDIYAIKEGKIVNHSNQFSKEKELSDEYLTKKKIKKIKKTYTEILNYEECSDCN